MFIAFLYKLVHTRFPEKFNSWSWTWVKVVFLWTWVKVVFLLIWCDAVQSLEFDHLVISWLDAYAWFGGSEAHDVLEVCWTFMLDLEKRSTWCFSNWLNVYAWFEKAEHVMFLKLKSWKKVCVYKWKKVCIFKWASIFEDGEESLYLQRSFNLRGWSTSTLRESSSYWKNSI